MTYDQIEKMDKDDLVYAFKRMTEIAEEAADKLKEMEAKYSEIENESDAHGHIGYCEAVFSNLIGRMDSVIKVLTKK